MSAPQAFRLAIEACRPIRSSALRSRPFLHTRPFSHDRRLRKDGSDEITKGFPLPKPEPFEEQEQRPEDLSDARPQAIPGHGSASPFSDPSADSATDVSPSTVATEQPTAPPVPPPAEPAAEVSPNMNATEQATASAHPAAAESTRSTQPATQSSKAEFSNIPPPATADTEAEPPHMYPPNVLATHLAPMRHPKTHGIPMGSLQLRSYHVTTLEFFADFCMRAAFYLKMPAAGPVPLPKRIERWTTLRSSFAHKKSQENFERITYKRLITVYDAEPAAVETWLAFVRKWQFYGVGLKANVWAYEGVDVAKEMDRAYTEEISKELEGKLSMYGWNKYVGEKSSVDQLLLHSQKTGNHQGAPMMNVRTASMGRDMEQRSVGIDVASVDNDGLLPPRLKSLKTRE